jgi:hypothetical protein
MSSPEEERLCPNCGNFPLTKPAACGGHYNTQNTGKVYQKVGLSPRFVSLFIWSKCPSNTFTAESLCSYFVWREDLTSPPPSSTRPATVLCISEACQNARKARTANSRCSWAFCKECCLATGQLCSISGHSTTAPLLELMIILLLLDLYEYMSCVGINWPKK